MALQSGMKAARAVKKQWESNKGSSSAGRLIIMDGESVPVWFNNFLKPVKGIVKVNVDGETVEKKKTLYEEPYNYNRHYIKRLNNGQGGYENCSDENCVCCYQTDSGDKSIGKKSYQGAFSVVDARRIHKVEIQDESGKKNRYYTCTEDETCKYCKKGNEPMLSGVKHVSWSMGAVNQLDDANRTVGKRCASCSTGKIKLKAYRCPECGENVDLNSEDVKNDVRVKCGDCKEQFNATEMLETIACTNGCDEPRRATLADVIVLVTRSGKGQDTVYNFAPQMETLGQIPEELIKAASEKPLRLDEIYKGRDPAVVATTLGIRNPFGRSTHAAYEEEEEPTPRKKSRPDDDEVPI